MSPRGDGEGHVSIGAVGVVGREWGVFGSDGTSLGAMSSLIGYPVPLPSGWLGGVGVTATDGSVTAIDAVTFAGDGSTLRRVRTPLAPHASWELVGDPRGGAALVRIDPPPEGGACLGAIRRFDVSGVVASADASFEVALAPCPPEPQFVAAISTRGAAITRSARSVTWLDADGCVLASGIDPEPLDGRLIPLLDGSIAETYDAPHGSSLPVFAEYPYLATQGVPAPDWLPPHTYWDVARLPGGRGYALLTAATFTPRCTQQLVLAAPSGRACGRLTLPACDAGFAAAAGNVEVGLDGTVIQPAALESCRITWWPGLLRPR
jgi:hypothetical protein